MVKEKTIYVQTFWLNYKGKEFSESLKGTLFYSSLSNFEEMSCYMSSFQNQINLSPNYSQLTSLSEDFSRMIQRQGVLFVDLENLLFFEEFKVFKETLPFQIQQKMFDQRFTSQEKYLEYIERFSTPYFKKSLELIKENS